MQTNLTQLAQMIENGGHDGPAEPEGAPEYVAPEYVETTADHLREMLMQGGRAVVSVRSKQSGEHVTVVLVSRKKKETGHGWVPRNTAAGRVGLAEADCLEARDPDREYPDNYVGRFYTDKNQWRAGKDADRLRAWTAEKAIAYALGGYPLDHQADVFLGTSCCYCSRPLRHPESVARGVGPECASKHLVGKMAPHAS